MKYFESLDARADTRSHEGTTTSIVGERRAGPTNNLGLIAQQIRRYSELQPDHPAVVAVGSKPLSYRALQFFIDAFRTCLREAGFGPNARIAVGLPHGPHAALAIVATTCSAIAVPFNPKQTSAEIETRFDVLRLDAVLLPQSSDCVVRRVAERRGLTIIEAVAAKDSELGFKIIVRQTNSAKLSDESDKPHPETPAFILQTSGTSGEPKLIPFSHDNMLAAAARLQAWFQLKPEDRCLNASPVYYSHGLKVTVFTPLLTGGTIVFPTDPSRFDFSEWFSTLKPTWYSAGPTLHRLVFDHTGDRPDAKTAHALRFILSGGAPLPREVREGLQLALGVPVVEHYGSSEAAQIAANVPSPGPCKPGTCGVPWPDTLVIVDENGKAVAPGEQGEILLRGPTVISGYLDAEALNRASFVDGWFKTGDIGSLDEEGFLTLHGRRNDLINRGAEKIWPIEIENALMRHPAVAEAAAFAVPHPRLGEDVAAAVALRPGTQVLSVELRKYLGEILSSFKVPRQIFVLDRLPKGSTGKIMRRELSASLPSKTVAPQPVPISSADALLSKQLTELWLRLLKSGPLTIDDDFFEKGGDSLLAAEMLVEIERLIGRPVSPSILFEATTIRQLMGKLSGTESSQSKILLQLFPEGSKPPLVFFHGEIYGNGYYTKQLSDLLGPDQPLTVIAPHGIDDTFVPVSIEAMAADRLALIRKAHPHGPYRLAGYCVGGLVAFETARLLIAAGEKVEIVVMLDSPLVNGRPFAQRVLSCLGRLRPIVGSYADPIMARAVSHLIRADMISNRSELQMAWAWFRSVAAGVRRQSLARLGAKTPAVATHGAVRPKINPRDNPAFYGTYDDLRYSGYYKALANYIPSPAPIPIVYFSVEYKAAGWRSISSKIEEIKMFGDHATPIMNVRALASYLQAAFKDGVAR
jgi:acyl-CoA synthetase (AMP-forming)/AMP-acid ligase II/thioesterase domain-containing protein